jgi:WD40 repeat protein
LATVWADGALRLWDARDGHLVRQLGQVQAPAQEPDTQPASQGSDPPTKAGAWKVLALGFSPDGRLLAGGCSDKMIRVWGVGGGEFAAPPLPHGTQLVTVAFSLDGKLLAGISQGSGTDTASLWSTETWQLVRHVAGGRRFSPDGKFLATIVAERTAQLWSLQDDRAEPLTFPHDRRLLESLAFSPDGRLLATIAGLTAVRFWDVATGRPCAPALLHGYAHFTVFV